jgi:hypothetical protein
MRQSSSDRRLLAGVAAFGALALSACTTGPTADVPPPAPAVAAEIPASIRPEEVVGRWGYASYHKDPDRVRTEAAARGQCGQPVVINRGPSGGVMMYLADSAQLQELRLKGGPGGKNYIGPPGESGVAQDREVVSFDGRVMLLRWVDPEIAGRYGTGIYVRCAPEGVARTSRPAPPPR